VCGIKKEHIWPNDELMIGDDALTVVYRTAYDESAKEQLFVLPLAGELSGIFSAAMIRYMSRTDEIRITALTDSDLGEFQDLCEFVASEATILEDDQLYKINLTPLAGSEVFLCFFRDGETMPWLKSGDINSVVKSHRLNGKRTSYIIAFAIFFTLFCTVLLLLYMPSSSRPILYFRNNFETLYEQHRDEALQYLVMSGKKN